MNHAWTYMALALVAAAAGGGAAYYYGFGQTAQLSAQTNVPLRVHVEGIARGGATFISGITVSVGYNSPSGQVTDYSVTDAFGTATFNAPTNAVLTITDTLGGYKMITTGTTGQQATLYHVWYSS